MKLNQSSIKTVVYNLVVLALIQGCSKPTDSGLLTGVRTAGAENATDAADQQTLERIQKERSQLDSNSAKTVVEKAKREKMTRAPQVGDKKKEANSGLNTAATATDQIKILEQKGKKEEPVLKEAAPAAVKETNPDKTCIHYENLKLETSEFIGAKTDEQIKLQTAQSTASQLKKSKTDITKNAAATDTEHIKSSNNTYLTFNNLAALNQISDTTKVLFRSKVVEQKLAESLLPGSNENFYCRTEGASSFAANDALTFSSQAKMLISKDLDIYEDRLEFVNSNGNLSFICTHTTAGFFIEEFAKNFNGYITLVSDKAVMSTKTFVNPFTKDRAMNAVQILNIEKMNLISMPTDAKNVLTSENKSICKVIEKMGDYDMAKTYFKVAQGPSVKAADSKSTIESSVYQADKDNYFVMACQVSVSAVAADELMTAAKDVIKFSVLNRVDYNQKYKQALSQREVANPTGSACQSSSKK